METFLSVALWLQQYSVVGMFAVFTGLMVTVFWPGRRERFERDAQIPLHDDR
jgi:cbb3-type cytochrome oxidase subunit 3